MSQDKLLNLKDENTRGDMTPQKQLDPETGGKLIFKKRRLRAAIFWVKENQSKLAIVFLSVAAIITAGYFILNSPAKPESVDNQPAEKTERNIEKKIEGLSRVTFFFTQPLKGSLAMPEHWEGRYRLENGENTATFSYIMNAESVTPIFTITIYPQEEWGKLAKKEGKIILTEENFVFVYRKNENNPYTGVDKERFAKMLLEADDIINSFKVFTL